MSFMRLRPPERSLTLDAGTLKCLATAATTAVLAAPSTGGAVTHTSSTPSFHEDLACEALGWTRTLITTPGLPYAWRSSFEALGCFIASVKLGIREDRAPSAGG